MENWNGKGMPKVLNKNFLRVPSRVFAVKKTKKIPCLRG